jgi:hypothetical protein
MSLTSYRAAPPRDRCFLIEKQTLMSLKDFHSLRPFRGWVSIWVRIRQNRAGHDAPKLLPTVLSREKIIRKHFNDLYKIAFWPHALLRGTVRLALSNGSGHWLLVRFAQTSLHKHQMGRITADNEIHRTSNDFAVDHPHMRAGLGPHNLGYAARTIGGDKERTGRQRKQQHGARLRQAVGEYDRAISRQQGGSREREARSPQRPENPLP